MMEFGMRSIAEVLMALRVHKGLPEHKGLRGLMERLEHRGLPDRKDLPDQRDQQVLPGQLAQQVHKALLGPAEDSTAGM
jgi:hypothetical protein